MTQENVELFCCSCVEQRGGLDPTDAVRLTAVKLKINDGLENSLCLKEVEVS